MMKQRDISIDNLKAFAIMLVVLGHSMQYIHFLPFEGYDKMFLNPVNKWIYLIHMPLFVFLSGIFHENTLPVIDFAKKIFGRLILPMAIWAAVCTLYDYLFKDKALSIETYKSLFKYGWWFIWTIAECKMTLYLFCKCNAKWIATFAVVLLYIIYPILDKIIPRYNLYLSCLPFYFAGYYYNKYKEYITKKWGICFLLLVMLVAISLIWNKKYVMYWSKYGIDIANYYYFIVRCFAGLSGIYLCLFMFKKYFNVQIKSLLSTKNGRG